MPVSLLWAIVVQTLSTIINPACCMSMTLKQTMLNATNITKPGCPRKCGNLTVPYPFGIGVGAGCSRGSSYDVSCIVTTFDPPRAFLPAAFGGSGESMEILHISETHVYLTNQVAYRCFNSTAETSPSDSDFVGLIFETSHAPYSVSATANNLFGVGCNDTPNLVRSTSAISDNSFSGDGELSCWTFCNSGATNVVAGECDGHGCCQSTMNSGMKAFFLGLDSDRNHTETASYNPCGYAFVADHERFRFRGVADLNDPNFVNRTIVDAPLVLDWVITPNSTCAAAQLDLDSYACMENTDCENVTDSGIGGYRCTCSPGYEGNPYLSPGCSDIDECIDLVNTSCSMECINIPGNYICSCPSGYSGDGKKDGTGCKRQFPIMAVGLGVGFASLLMLITGTWLCLAHKKRRILKMKENFFEQNGGFLLKQLINPNKQDNIEPIKVFTIEELKAATKNFNDDRIVGRGGYGTVYQGVIQKNIVVAIKKSKFLDESQIEQFINELIILARIRHHGVVRLLGCCLEVEVPLLVYEFISNGTLHDHLHNKDGASWYSWRNCLQITMDLADALAYLHSIPIIHRDIKSSNILMNKSYKAKIADFGASRLIPLNNTHLSTIVQGTLGYLDPEYFFSSQLTEKSDVYSFGVVLAELLTRTTAILPERQTEEHNYNLAAYFVKSMQQDQLFNILDSQLIVEATQEQLMLIATLVQRCLNVKGDDRPTMKEVAIELEQLWKETMQLSKKEYCDANITLEDLHGSIALEVEQ